MVLINKGDGRDFWGIGLIEVLWKTMKGILNRFFTSVIQFHDVLNGFWAGHGTGTANIKYKLIQQLTHMMEEVLYEIFMDLQKAYDAQDQDRCLKIIAAYGLGPRALHSGFYMHTGVGSSC